MKNFFEVPVPTKARKLRSFFFFGCSLSSWNPQASAPITSEMHTDGGAEMGKPGSAWLEGTPAMDLGHMNVVLK